MRLGLDACVEGGEDVEDLVGRLGCVADTVELYHYVL